MSILTQKDFDNIDKWINSAGIMIEANIRTQWTPSERETFKKLDQLKQEVKE